MASRNTTEISPFHIGLWAFIVCIGSMLGHYFYSQNIHLITGGSPADSVSQNSSERLTLNDRKRQAEELRQSMKEKDRALMKKYASKNKTNTDESKTNLESRRDWDKKKDQIKKQLKNFKNQRDAPEGSIKANLQNQLKQLNSDKPMR